MPRVCINVTGKNSQPYRFSLDRKIVRLGRAADNDIIIDCPSVSSHHCEMRRVGGGYILQDLDSTNGIKVDESRMEVIDLENDMEITVGDAEMEFELTDDERGALGEEDHSPHAKAKLPPLDKVTEDEDDYEYGDSFNEDLDEEVGSEDEEKPKKKPKKPKKQKKPPPAPRPTTVGVSHASGAANFFITLVFLALSVAAFFFGMSLKHKKKTERSLWNDLFGNPAPVEQVQE